MTLKQLLAELDAQTWDASTTIEQGQLIKKFLIFRQNATPQESAILEMDFQRRLNITRDEWFRLLVSRETERIKLLDGIWQKHALPKLAPTAITNVSTSTSASTISNPYPRSGWIGEYMYDFATNMESPDSFIFWSAIATLSAVVRRKVWFQFGNNKVYPNFYIVLVSKAGLARKDAPIKAAAKLAGSIPDVHFIRRTTSERLPHDLSYRIQPNPTGGTVKVPCDATAFICSQELVTFLGKKSYNEDILGFLIEWWDCQDYWDTSSISHNIVKLNNIHLTLFGGTTPTWLEGALNHIVSGGGMLRRTIFVVEDRTDKELAWPEAASAATEQRLMQQLAYIDTIQGEFIVTPEAHAWNKVWYSKFRKYLRDNPEEAEAIESKQIHMIKLAVLLALSDNAPLLITPFYLEIADKILSINEEKLPEAARILTSTPTGRDYVRVTEHIKKAGPSGIQHAELLRRNSPYGVDREFLYKITRTLEEQGTIEIKYDSKPGRKTVTWYIYKGGTP